MKVTGNFKNVRKNARENVSLEFQTVECQIKLQEEGQMSQMDSDGRPNRMLERRRDGISGRMSQRMPGRMRKNARETVRENARENVRRYRTSERWPERMLDGKS